MEVCKKGGKFSLPMPDVVYSVAFSPFHWIDSLMAVGMRCRVTILSCKIPDDNSGEESVNFDVLRDFNHGCRVQAIAWSPQTTLTLIPKNIKFATAGGDRKIRVFSSDLKNDDTVQHVEGHSDYINDLAFDPQTGEQLASVSDDHTCCVWSPEGNLVARLFLTSPGMSVRWHTEEVYKLLVAEKKGVIRFYNIGTQQPVMSLECTNRPLLSADWSPANSLRVGCVAGSDWFLWDTSISSQPLEQQTAHIERGVAFTFAHSHRELFATRGLPENQIKVNNRNLAQAILSATLNEGSGLSWHCRLPLLAAGGDREVVLWKIEST